MHQYSISAGNPEGTDFLISFSHDKEFTKEEFHKIGEEAMIYALEKEFEKQKYASISSVDSDFICEYMLKLGFAPVCDTASYYLEPYWGKESVVSEKLMQWIDRSDIQDVPQYMKEHELEKICLDKF